MIQMNDSFKRRNNVYSKQLQTRSKQLATDNELAFKSSVTTYRFAFIDIDVILRGTGSSLQQILSFKIYIM